MLAILDSLWFLGLAGFVFFFLLMLCEVKETGFWSFALFVALIAGVQWYSVLHGNNFWVYLLNHIEQVLLCLVGYIAVGIPWAIFKWYLYAKDRLEEYEVAKTKFSKLKGNEGLAVDEIHRLWLLNVKEEKRTGWTAAFNDFPPKVSKHKAKIARWMSCWFTSLLWTFLSDFITDLFRRIVDLFSGFFQRISNRVFAKHLDDLKGLD